MGPPSVYPHQLCEFPRRPAPIEKDAACAFIVEPRRHGALRLSTRSVRQTLGPATRIFVFHGCNPEDAEYAREQLRGLDPITYVPLKVGNLDAYEYSVLLACPEFYYFFGATYALCFQSDALLLPFSPFKLTDFYGYDWVGAPWAWAYGRKGNGGVSLRNVPRMRQILYEHPYPNHIRPNEDLYISQLPDVSVAPPDLMRQFSVESLYFSSPFALHAPWKHLRTQQLRQLAQYAPCFRELLLHNGRELP